MAARSKHPALRSAYSSSGSDWKDRVQERERSKRLLAMQVGLRVQDPPWTRQGNKSILYFDGGKYAVVFCREHEPCLLFGMINPNIGVLAYCTKCPQPTREPVYMYSSGVTSTNTIYYI